MRGCEAHPQDQSWWAQQGSNLQPGDYESLALTIAP